MAKTAPVCACRVSATRADLGLFSPPIVVPSVSSFGAANSKMIFTRAATAFLFTGLPHATAVTARTMITLFSNVELWSLPLVCWYSMLLLELRLRLLKLRLLKLLQLRI